MEASARYRPTWKHNLSLQVGSISLPNGQVMVPVTAVLDSVRQQALLCDCSTIVAEVAKEVSAASAARGIAMLDAPVSGGTAGGRRRHAHFIVGGEDGALNLARSILAAMGKNIFDAGGEGAGQVAEICNNMLLEMLIAGTAEALNLGVAHGLDLQVLSR